MRRVKQCTVVRVECGRFEGRGPADELLPWADPYIAMLVGQLERAERAERRRAVDDWEEPSRRRSRSDRSSSDHHRGWSL